MHRIQIDFSKSDGDIKPLHGVNCAPYDHNGQAFVTKAFTDAKIPYSRLHDCMGKYGGAHFVDIPNIFPNFDLDEDDPNNYDFTLTDDYIGCIVKAGTKIVYRLGITIDWGIKKYHTKPPKDYEKWARICEHVIKHYNEGWADGFRWNITDWEIWNEPENPPMWSGTKQEFFDLYVVASKHLKSVFPNINIGGYGSCGFYALTRSGLGEFHESFVPYFTDFLDYIKLHNAPLDFFSWHIYNEDPEEILVHAKYVRDTLDAKGFVHTQSSLNEWNFGAEGYSFLSKKNMIGASYVAAVMAALQNSDLVDTAMYYVASLMGHYNGLFRFEDETYFKPFYSLCAWGDLWDKGTFHRPLLNQGTKLYCCAASGNSQKAVLLSNISNDEQWVGLEMVMDKPGVNIETYQLDESKDMQLIRREIFNGDIIEPLYEVPAHSVVFCLIKSS